MCAKIFIQWLYIFIHTIFVIEEFKENLNSRYFFFLFLKFQVSLILKESRRYVYFVKEYRSFKLILWQRRCDPYVYCYIIKANNRYGIRKCRCVYVCRVIFLFEMATLSWDSTMMVQNIKGRSKWKTCRESWKGSVHRL